MNSLTGDTMTHLLIALAFVVTIIVPSFVATNGLSTKKERTIIEHHP